jgi:hypothetical protein
MNEDDARHLLLVRAVETEDASETLLTREDRQAATASALTTSEQGGTGRRSDQRFLAARSAFAFSRLATRFPGVAQAVGAARWPGWLNWALPLAAFAVGIATNEIDGGKRLNIIAFPLFGIVAWNLLVYLLMAVNAARRLVRGRPARAEASWLARGAGWLSGVAGRYQDLNQPLGRAIARFARDWAHHAAALTYARASRVLHLSAAALAGGVVVGMYLRALGIEYRAGWESTFVGPATLHWLLGWLLAPASALSGIPLPDGDRLAALRWGLPGNGENAARWIHLYATTAALFVIGPRLLLATWSGLSAMRLRRFFTVPGRNDFYVRRLLRSALGGGTKIEVVPYGFAFSDGSRRVLERLLTATFGDGTRVTTDTAIAYGQEEEWLERRDLSDDNDYLIVLFNLAATPEAENHGELVAGLKRAIGLHRSGVALAVMLDETAYRQRLTGQAGADARLETRRLAWEQMLAATAVTPVTVDLANEQAPGQIGRLEAALLRSPTLAGAGA